MPADLTEPQRIFLWQLVYHGRVRVNRDTLPEADAMIALGLAIDETPDDAASMMLVPTETGRAADEEGRAEP